MPCWESRSKGCILDQTVFLSLLSDQLILLHWTDLETTDSYLRPHCCVILWQGGTNPVPTVIYLFPWRFSSLSNPTHFLHRLPFTPNSFAVSWMRQFPLFSEVYPDFPPLLHFQHLPIREQKMGTQSWTWWVSHKHITRKERKKGVSL